MTFSATRLTCFALISAMEEDMRAAIEEYLGEYTIAEVLPADRIERAQTRRQAESLSPATSVQGLLPYLDFGDSYQALMSWKKILPDELVASLTAVTAAEVTRLIAIRNRVAHTRPMEIDDSAHLLDIASLLQEKGKGHWAALAETLARLRRDPAFVLGLTINLPTDPDLAPQHNLPVPDFDETGFSAEKSSFAVSRRRSKAPTRSSRFSATAGSGRPRWRSRPPTSSSRTRISRSRRSSG